MPLITSLINGGILCTFKEAQPSLAGDGHSRDRNFNFWYVRRFRRAADPAGSVGGDDVDR